MAADIGKEGAEGAPEEHKGKSYWWLALFLTFLLLAGGGFYALTSMGKSAHKLAGGSDYDQLASNDAVYSGRSASGSGNEAFSSGAADPDEFPEEAGQAGKAAAAKSGLFSRPAARASGASGGGSAPVVYSDEEKAEERAQDQAAGAAASPQARLQAGGHLSGGKTPPAAKGRNFAASEVHFSRGGPAEVKAVPQRDTAAANVRKGGGGGVLDALKGAFRASLYGARIASQDSAKSWISRQFDGSAEAEQSLEYDEKMKAKLDRVNPNSIPQFLREQDISAAEAKTLASPDVGKPSVNVEGTKEALKNDADYQAKKMAKDLYAGAVNPMGTFFGGGGNTARGETEGTASEDTGGGMDLLSITPEDQALISGLALEDYVATEGYGQECGCTQDAPCCCLPQNSVNNSCPLYGPFLPNDPCGNYGTGVTGDFPPVNTNTAPV